MKITEKKTERTFILEISESSLQNLMGNLVFFPIDDEYRTLEAEDFLADFYAQLDELRIELPERSNFVKEPK